MIPGGSKAFGIEEEAKAVRDIFKMFAEGHSMAEIAVVMTERGVVRRNGSSEWNRHHVNIILRNEKYVGDAILQKSYTVDCLTHERARNYGQKPKYLIQNCHDPIIDRDTWDKVRLELARRSSENKSARKKGEKSRYHTIYALTSLLYCSHCGKPFRRTTWQWNGKKKGVWRCADRLESPKITCKKSPSIHEDKLHRAIVNIINSTIKDTEQLNAAVQESTQASRSEMMGIDKEIVTLSARIAEINALRDNLIGNISGNQFEFLSNELRTLNEEEQQKKERLDEIKQRKDNIKLEVQKAATAREMFGNMQPMECFDDNIIRNIIERITVNSKTEITVRFRGGLEISGPVEK